MMDRISAADLRAMQKPAKKNKFGAKRCQHDGIWFDSQAERNYYIALKERERAGEVGGIALQHKFQMIGPDGTKIGTYKPDFCFWDFTADRFRVVDVKGVQTREFRRTVKIMKSLNGITVEVAK